MPGRPAKLLLEAEIRIAIEHTRSNAAAARYLGVHSDTYRKYAQMYGLYDQHKNQPGRGVTKLPMHSPGRIPLEEILDGMYPQYCRYAFKKRLFLEGYMPEKCEICGFEERRVTDYRVPLMIEYRDGNKSNYKRENLRVLCFNCYFLVVGPLWGAHLLSAE